MIDKKKEYDLWAHRRGIKIVDYDVYDDFRKKEKLTDLAFLISFFSTGILLGVAMAALEYLDLIKGLQ